MRLLGWCGVRLFPRWSRDGNDLFLSVYESGGGEWAESAGKGGVARCTQPSGSVN